MKFVLFTLLIICSFFSACRDQEQPTILSCETSCTLTPDAGPCEAYKPRYYFDQTEGKCKEFIWGGCHGVVPFETLVECENCGCK